MEIIKLSWVGTRTVHAEETMQVFCDVLGLRLEAEHAGFWMLQLPDGSKVEVFGSESSTNRHFTTGPVVGFLVDDVFSATRRAPGQPGLRSCSSRRSTTVATPGSTFGDRTETSTSSPRIPECLGRIELR